MLCEDDHYVDTRSLLVALSFFDAKLTMSLSATPARSDLASYAMQRTTIEPKGRLRLHPTRERCFDADAFRYVPMHNPLLLTNGAVRELAPGMSVGSTRAQCTEMGITQDNAFGILLWMLRIPIVAVLTECALIHLSPQLHSPIGRPVQHCFNLSSSGDGAQTAACAAELEANEALAARDGVAGDTALSPSHFIVHAVKKREEMLRVHKYFHARQNASRFGSPRAVLRRCLQRYSPQAVRLRFIRGYESTQHFVRYRGQPYSHDGVNGTWATFRMADCRGPPTIKNRMGRAIDSFGELATLQQCPEGDARESDE